MGAVSWPERISALRDARPGRAATVRSAAGGGAVAAAPRPAASRRRDARAISHHYDVSNRFY